ncbi:MAG: radical SAM protein [Thermodesulfobacteriota bacterium]
MKDRILLIHLAHSESDVALSPFLRLCTFPQLGLLYLAGKLREGGFRPDYLDSGIEPGWKKVLDEFLEDEALLFVGIYTNVATADDVCGLVRTIKRKSRIHVLVGGPGYFEADRYLKSGADAVVGGEAESIICEIARNIQRKRSIQGIDGVTVPTEGEVKIAPLAPAVQDLRTLPRPAWDLAVPGRFHHYTSFPTRHPYYCVTASRGCPMACTYCSQLYGRKEAGYRLRPADDVVSEIVELNERYGVRHIKFQDDFFGGNREWLETFCTRLIRTGVAVNWNAYFYPMFFARDPEPLLQLMKKARCVCIHFGLQSATPDILRKVRRNPREPEILKGLIPHLKRMGFFSIIDFIYGLPGETARTMAHNLQYSLETGVHLIQNHPIKVMPNTELARQSGDLPPTGLTQEEIEKAIQTSYRIFLSRPGVLGRNLRYILRYNPLFLLRAFRIAPLLVRMLGSGIAREKGAEKGKTLSHDC